jgi:CBS domain-containing protein
LFDLPESTARRCIVTTTSNTLLDQTTADLMSREVITIPEDMSLRAAAHLLFRNHIGGAPVVDGDGRCIGVLSATDFVHWTEEGAQGADEALAPSCCYQTRGRLQSGEDVVVCTLAEGSCPLQEMRAGIGGERLPMCRQPTGVLTDWQQVADTLPVSAVKRYMTTDVVTVGPHTRLPELARTMLDAHIHRVIVVDTEGKPIGIVSSTDILAALAYSEVRP